MRIGLFTDSYHPAMNGIVTVVDLTRRELEAAGHEVFIFCPGVRGDEKTKNDDHVVRFPSLPTSMFEGNRLSVFFPQRVMKRIRALELDVMHFFTPWQVGLMAVYAAERTGTVLIAQHSTDIYEYVRHYPQVLPGLLLVGTTFPFTVKFNGEDIRTLLSMYKVHRGGPTAWNQDIIEKAMALFYSRCDQVVALSRKSEEQLASWRTETYEYDLTIMPTGVDPLPAPKKAEVQEFKKTWGINKDSKVMGYVGRLSAEKNLERTIDAFAYLASRHDDVVLLFVGDFEYREVLEQLAEETGYSDRIIFTGKIPREQLGVAYAALDVFVMTSMTDTQGLVIHEAANAGCPIVMTDRKLSEVVIDGENGFYANDNRLSVARKVESILYDDELRAQFAKASKRLGRKFTEKGQVKKQIAMYESLLAEKDRNKERRLSRFRRYLAPRELDEQEDE